MPAEFKEVKTPLDDQMSAIVIRFEAMILALVERAETQARQAEAWRVQAAPERKRAAYQAAPIRRGKSCLSRRRTGARQDLRGLIAAVEASPTALTPDDPWRVWAQAQPDALDPVLSGAAPFALLPSFEAREPDGQA